MASEYKPIYSVKLWTSSHGMPRHHLPQSFNEIYKANPFIEKPIINAKPGRFINENMIDEFKKDFETIPFSRPQINVTCFGDNDIRSNAFKGGFFLYKFTKEMIDLHKDSKNPLLVLGVMPSPATFYQTHALSEYSDDLIQKYILKFHENNTCPHLSFATTAEFFSDEEGFLLNKIYFENDQIHLNKTGADQFARNILEISTILAQICQEKEKG